MRDITGKELFNSQFSILNSLLDPLSSATVPLLYGLARRSLLRGGATQHQAQVNGIAINYYRQGAWIGRQGDKDTFDLPSPGLPVSRSPGLPILLVHGIADNALTWVFVMRLLARDHDVYALDLPGYGLSGTPNGRHFATLTEMRDLLGSFVREVVGRPALVVGNSMGGWLAVKLAWAAPELTRASILVNAGGAPLEGRTSWEPFGELISVRDLRASRQILGQMFGGIPAPLLYLGQRGLQQLFHRRVVRAFVADMTATIAAEDDLLKPDDLRRLPVPAGVVWGLSDRFLPRGSLEFFRDNLPNAPTLLLRRCGHLPQRERPIAMTRFVRQFAVQVAARTKN
ncbi:MAG TPA: alpha/beta hydrolase [Roseiflexaceae bacterium]|nr:alpha/beta hydrolase [Roseiflexaceae bacterium]